MSNAYTSIVNRELYVAAVHLDLMPEPTNGNQRIIAAALMESSVFHLVMAHRAFLRELASNYQLPAPDQIFGLGDMRSQLQVVGKDPAEVSELENLAAAGWLGDLETCFQSIGNVGGGSSEQSNTVQDKEFESGGRIATVEIVNSEPLELNPELIRRWIGNYRDLISRHREIMVEY